MRRFFTSPILAITLLAVAPVLAAILYPGLPETIPVHFNASGIADRFGPKSSIWVHISILFVVGIAVYFLIRNIHKIDPKKTANVSIATYESLAMVIAFFLSLTNTSMVLATTNSFNSFSITKVVLPAVGLLITVMGYYIRSIKPNYFIGLRLPWTLEDEDNWTATHQLAAKLWIPAGLLMAATAVVFPFMIAFIVTMALALVIVIIPAIYSYRFFKNKKA